MAYLINECSTQRLELQYFSLTIKLSFTLVIFYFELNNRTKLQIEKSQADIRASVIIHHETITAEL